MESELEKMLEAYKPLDETTVVSSAEKASRYLRKQRLWEAIRQEIKDYPKALQMKLYRASHPEKAYAAYLRQKDSHKQLKVEVLTHYGNQKLACVQCGEDRVACLSIDHIEGGGNKQRKGKLRASTAFYRWLKREGYPEGYQTLCMNDQFVKRFEREEHN